jgi:uncharacterized membrane protein
MALFILGLIVFFVPHFATPFARGWRERTIQRLGEGPYKGLYSLVSAVGFGLIVYGWRQADATALYSAPDWMRYVTQAFMLLAFVLLAAAYLPRGKIAHVVKHPMLASVKLWAFGHLLVNGEVRSLILFGSFLAYAAFDRIAVKRRGAPVPAEGPVRNDAIAVAVGVGAWFAVYFVLHRYIAGVSLR